MRKAAVVQMEEIWFLGQKKLKDSLETQQGIQVQVSMGPSFPLYRPFPKMIDT